MAWTATTLRAAISSYLENYETEFVATYIDTSILQAEDRISKAVILPMNRASTTLIFTALDETVALPEGFLAPFELSAETTAGYLPVEYVDVSFMRSAFPDPTVTGTPRWYSIFNADELILCPAPTAGITGWFNYFKKPESITTASTSWLGTNAENCLLYGCLAEAYTYIKGEMDLQKEYETKFMAALDALKTLGEGLDLGDAWRMGERRTAR